MESELLENRLKVSHPERIQLYSAGTANGLKVAACLEEIQELRKDKGDTIPFDYEVSQTFLCFSLSVTSASLHFSIVMVSCSMKSM
jgi:hypothetical protein